MSPSSHYTADEMMIVAASRALNDGDVCFVGIGLPSTAANLAKRTHAPHMSLIYESGVLGARPSAWPLSMGDGVLTKEADAVVSVPEVFNYWLQGARIDVGFLAGAQIDRYANINTTIIGDDYWQPDVRLPGGGGAPEIAAFCARTLIMARETRRTFVERVDFVTSVGHGGGAGDRGRRGLPGGGPSLVITDLGLMRPDSISKELQLSHTHPDVPPQEVRKATGWSLDVAGDVSVTDPPSAES